MNIVGKIFVFAVFVMSLVFMSFAVALYSTHTNWKEEIERTSDQVRPGKPLGYKEQVANLEKQRKELEEEINSLVTKVKASETARDNVIAQIQTAIEEKNAALQELRKKVDDQERQRDDAQKQLAAKSAELEEANDMILALRDEIKTQQATLDDQVKRTSELAVTLHEKESFLTIAEERQAQLEKQVANARLLLQESGLSVESMPKDHVPNVKGVVTAVGSDSVELSLGGDDGLQKGHELEVYRGGTYLGRVRVVSVRSDRAVATVLRDFKRGFIQRGDRVATKLDG